MPSLITRSLAALAFAALAALVLACGAKNPNFCEGADCTSIDASIDSPPATCTGNGPDPSCPAATPVCASGECTGMCTADTDCAGRAAGEGVCHMPSGACVACDEDDVQATPMQAEDECPGANNAVCDSATHTCRACKAHSECFSGVCDAGRCAPQAEVIYMVPAADGGTDNGGNDCLTPSTGCLTLNYAIGKLTVTRKYILMKPSATPYAARSNTDRADFNGDTAHVIGYGATVRRGAADGEVIEVHGAGVNVIIEGLTVERATGAAGNGILCSAGSLELRGATVRLNQNLGISAGSCSLKVSRSTISGNTEGGILLTSGTFNLTNNFIVSNGNIATATFGGVSLSSGAATNSLSFNTIALNASQVAATDGVTCTNSGLVARNNIIIGSATKPHVNPGTNCEHRYTLFTPDNPATGEGNMMVADQGMYAFVSGTNFHIGAGSVAAGKAQSTNLTGESLFDVDGDPRTPDGTTVDVGADEIP